MADYYPLIARAIDGLADKSPVVRRAVYDRARKALVTQLQNLDPPASNADIERETAALNLAINSVEARYILPAQQAATEAELPHEPSQVLLEPINPEVPSWQESQTVDVPDAAAPLRDEPEIPASDELEQPDIIVPERPRIGSKHHSSGQANRVRAIILVASVLAVVVSIAGMKLYKHNLEQRHAASPQAIEAAEQQNDAEESRAAEPGKFTERLGGETAPTRQADTGETTTSTVAVQRAILVQADAATAQLPMNQQTLVATYGTVHWTLDQVDGGDGHPLETVIRADAVIPQSGFKLQMTIRKVDDGSAYAHLVELLFSQADGDTLHEVIDIAPIELKDNEEELRGLNLSGMIMPVAKNVFMVGLSDLQSSVERNVQLMQDKNWFDVSVTFPDGQRGRIMLEKGPTGFQVVSEAFRRW